VEKEAEKGEAEAIAKLCLCRKKWCEREREESRLRRI